MRHNHDAESDYLFDTTPDWSKMKEEGYRWMTESVKLLARTRVKDVTPTLCFEHVLQKGMQDVRVACWVGKLWSETVAIPRRKGEKASSASAWWFRLLPIPDLRRCLIRCTIRQHRLS